jgi:hypothetical protein
MSKIRPRSTITLWLTGEAFWQRMARLRELQRVAETQGLADF